MLAGTTGAMAASCEETAQPGRFVIQGDEVRDTKTGLVWQRCSLGQKAQGAACTGTVEAMNWDQAKKAAKGGWRLPTLDELTGIVMQPCGLPAEEKKVFSEIDPLKPWYWTATTTESNLAWMVGFNNGSTFNGFRTAPNAVRLVRSGR
jgi:hypothetical protein